MTVKDLLEQLKEFDDDCEITLKCYHDWKFYWPTDDFDIDFYHYEYDDDYGNIVKSRDVVLSLDFNS